MSIEKFCFGCGPSNVTFTLLWSSISSYIKNDIKKLNVKNYLINAIIVKCFELFMNVLFAYHLWTKLSVIFNYIIDIVWTVNEHEHELNIQFNLEISTVEWERKRVCQSHELPDSLKRFHRKIQSITMIKQFTQNVDVNIRVYSWYLSRAHSIEWINTHWFRGIYPNT